MSAFVKARGRVGLSQRVLAARARVAFRTIQLLEKGRHDPRVSTLERVASAMGYPDGEVQRKLGAMFDLPPDSIAMVTVMMARKQDGWKTHLFNFVDGFRKTADPKYVSDPPVNLPPKLQALTAATVETLCQELRVDTPWWCQGVRGLPEPWFVSGVENLKAMALASSPTHFRKRNVFVLDNFLDRA